ncbi:septum site-determining protein Ssd [Ornithinimicrobium cavernae]|uniref:septum site-determining protein Ssd n=1 Tax=Ornithinimicrobium cavernae TaxID=2666047 RepID=UPI00137B40DE|nr:septum site-determining protein Ssd [Ornithinimicrobium cavernae]
MTATNQADRPAGGGVVLGVLGASGGVGASTLATACAVRASAARRDVVLVDAHPWGGGLDVLAGLDAEPGLRWTDLQGIRGDVDPHRLVGELPATDEGLRCVSWGVQPPEGDPPGPRPVLTAVRAAVELTVVDLPRPAAPVLGHQQWWAMCDEVVLLVEASVVGLGAAATVSRAVHGLSGVVLRWPSVLPEEDIASALGAPVLARLAEDRTVRSCLERGRAVASESGPLTDAADEVLCVLLPGLRAA